MHLFIVRHAIAEDAKPGQDDASRELTGGGERKLKRVVHGLRALGVHFDRVLTSPWVRAMRTAKLLAPIADGTPIATDLLCNSPKRELLAMIAETSTDQKNHATAVIGHEPWLGELVALLALGDPKHGEPFLIKKACVVWLEGSAVSGGMMIRAMLPPSVLRELR